VADSDQQGTSPGSDTLAKLFRAHSPCLILIDEWVAYARQLFEKSDLPAGNFDSQGSFAQALTEAAKAAPDTLVVASIPQSRIEIGGENGITALDVLKTFLLASRNPGDQPAEKKASRLFDAVYSSLSAAGTISRLVMLWPMLLSSSTGTMIKTFPETVPKGPIGTTSKPVIPSIQSCSDACMTTGQHWISFSEREEYCGY